MPPVTGARFGASARLATLAGLLAVMLPSLLLAQSSSGLCPGTQFKPRSSVFERLVVPTAATGVAVTLSSATIATAVMAVIGVEGQAVRHRDDQTAPTGGIGRKIAAGGELVVCGDQIRAIKFLTDSAAPAGTTGVLGVSYYFP